MNLRRTLRRELAPPRLIERLCFLVPPVVGVGVIGVLQEADPGVPGLGLALLVVSSFGYGIVVVALGIAVFVDARRVKAGEVPTAGVDPPAEPWRPRPWLYGIGVVALAPVLLGPFVATVYLHGRHRRFGTPAGWSWWWLVVAFSLGTTLIGIVAAIAGIVLAIPGLVTSAVAVAGAVAVGSFPVAIHQDAAYVNRVVNEDGWRPNPGGYLGLALASLFLPIVHPAFAAYYLLRRTRLGE